MVEEPAEQANKNEKRKVIILSKTELTRLAVWQAGRLSGSAAPLAESDSTEILAAAAACYS